MPEIDFTKLTPEQQAVVRKAQHTVSKPINTTKTGGGEDIFLKQIQDSLLAQSKLVSSTSSDIEESISGAISGIEKSREASAQRIESAFDRQIGEAEGVGERALTSSREAQRGYATNTAALRQIREDTDKQVKDLEQRKQELILAGEAESASKIADLQFQALQFRQQAQQQVFSNILGMGQFGIQAQQEQRLARQQEFSEKQAVGNIALEFGLDVREGESLEGVIQRAAPLATKERKLALERMQAEINQIRISTAKAAREGQLLSSADIDTMAKAALLNPAVLGQIKNAEDVSKVINKMASMEGDAIIKPLVLQAIADGEDLNTVLQDISASPSIQNKFEAQKVARELYQKETPQTAREGLLSGPTKSPLLNLVSAGVVGLEALGSSVFKGITGREIRGGFTEFTR